MCVPDKKWECKRFVCVRKQGYICTEKIHHGNSFFAWNNKMGILHKVYTMNFIKLQIILIISSKAFIILNARP